MRSKTQKTAIETLVKKAKELVSDLFESKPAPQPVFLTLKRRR